MGAMPGGGGKGLRVEARPGAEVELWTRSLAPNGNYIQRPPRQLIYTRRHSSTLFEYPYAITICPSGHLNVPTIDPPFATNVT